MIGFCCLALAALCLWSANDDQRAHEAIAARGEPTTAEVLARRIHSDGNWWLAYVYRLPDGTMAQGKGPALREVEPGGNADPFRRGSAVRILYHPAEPTRSLPENAPEPGRNLAWVSLGTLAGIVGLSLLSLAFGEAHRPPRKPAPTERPIAPRHLRIRNVLRFPGLWILGLLAVLAGGMWWLSQAGPRADTAFWQAAVAQQTAEGPAIVTARRMGSRITGRNLQTGQTRRSQLFFIDYRFEGPDGVPRQGQSRVTGVEYDRFLPGTRVLVRILRDAPDTHALALAAPVLDNWYLRSLATISGVLALIALVASWAELGSRWRAARSGIAREVKVTGHRTVFAGLVEFGWADADGAEGWSGGVSRHLLPPVGATLLTRVDPNDGHIWWDATL